MSDTAQAIAAPPALMDDYPYTPQDIAKFYRVSTSFVHKQIQAGKLRAFRFGERLLRVKGREAKRWVDELENTNSGSSATNGASSGTKRDRKSVV